MHSKFITVTIVMQLVVYNILQTTGQKSEQTVDAQTNPTIINYGDGDVTVTTSADTSSKTDVHKDNGRGPHTSGSFPAANVGDQFTPQFMSTLLSAMANNNGGQIELGGDVVNEKSQASTYAIGRSADGKLTVAGKPPTAAFEDIIHDDVIDDSNHNNDNDEDHYNDLYGLYD